jgi:hypothetical protein
MNWKYPSRLIPCLILATAAPADVPNPVDAHGYVDVEQLSYWTTHRLRDSDFGQVDQALRKYADLAIRDVNGKPALDAVVNGIDRYARKEALGVHAIDDVQTWRKRAGDSTAGILVESRLWFQAAWAARGPGTAAHVTDEGWKLYSERLAKAEKILHEGHDAASTSPAWYSMYMDATLGLDGHDADVERYFREGSARFPDYYELYFAYLQRKLPQWFGSRQELFAAIDGISRHGQSDESPALYARLVWSASNGLRLKDGWITDQGADWNAMRRGFDLIHADFPHSTWNAANFMTFACHAKDRESYQKWRNFLGENVERYTSDLDVDVFECDRRLRPMSAATENYERHLDSLDAINARLISACYAEPRDAREVAAGFRQLLDWRNTAFELIEREKPEMTGIPPAPGALEKVKPGNPKAVCDALKFNPGK